MEFMETSTMLIGLDVAAIMALASLGVITILAITAPDGWEDDDGFHYGKEDGE
jgi:uncharacterized membrane protein